MFDVSVGPVLLYLPILWSSNLSQPNGGIAVVVRKSMSPHHKGASVDCGLVVYLCPPTLVLRNAACSNS